MCRLRSIDTANATEFCWTNFKLVAQIRGDYEYNIPVRDTFKQAQYIDKILTWTQRCSSRIWTLNFDPKINLWIRSEPDLSVKFQAQIRFSQPKVFTQILQQTFISENEIALLQLSFKTSSKIIKFHLSSSLHSWTSKSLSVCAWVKTTGLRKLITTLTS